MKYRCGLRDDTVWKGGGGVLAGSLHRPLEEGECAAILWTPSYLEDNPGGALLFIIFERINKPVQVSDSADLLRPVMYLFMGYEAGTTHRQVDDPNRSCIT